MGATPAAHPVAYHLTGLTIKIPNIVMQNPWEADSHSAGQEIQSFMELEGQLRYSHEPVESIHALTHSFIRVIKSRKMRWAGNVVRMWAM
jgi:hypothetical protein